MKSYSRLALFGTTALALSFFGCSGTSSSSRGASGVTTIDELPLATSPVVDSSSSSLALFKNASTGINMGSLSQDSYNSSSSLAACDATNRFKEGITAAAQGDLILCYVQNVMAANSNTGVDLYDGNYHVFALDFGDAPSEEGGGPSKVKMKIARDSSGNISQFEMFACGDQGSSSNTQTEYLNQTISSNGAFAMTSKGLGGDGQSTWTHQATVSGTISNGGQFTGTKTVAMAFTNVSDLFGDGRGEGILTQTSDALTYNGWEAGTFIDQQNGFEGSYQNRTSSAAQLIDGNEPDAGTYNLQLLAVGDGASHSILSGSGGDFTWDENVTEGWNGDTTAADSSAGASYISVVEEISPPEVRSAVTVQFEGSEVYDCSDAAEATVTVDEAALETECSHLELGHEWINCWQIIDGG